jgi:hypothetical protein
MAIESCGEERQVKRDMEYPGSIHRTRDAQRWGWAPDLRIGELCCLGAAVVTALVVLLLSVGVPVAVADSCPNAAFRTGLSASLPDCRAYEMVSPPFKFGQYVVPNQGFLDATHVAFVSFGGFNGAEDDTNLTGSNYLAGRSELSGWSATPVDPPASEYRSNLGSLDVSPLVDASSDFSYLLFVTTPVGGSPFGMHFYLREPTSAISEVGPLVPPAAETYTGRNGLNEEYSGASSDLSHVFFTAHKPEFRWPGDTTISVNPSLYEYTGTANGARHQPPKLVGVNDENQLISQCGTLLGGINPQNPLGGGGDSYNAISTDGTTVFFTAIENGVSSECAAAARPAPPVNELFARINGSRTVAISEPLPTDCSTCKTEAPSSAEFQGASQNGSKAFFITDGSLLQGAAGRSLYEYNFDAEEEVHASGQRVALLAPQVLGVARVSEDGSHVYFVSEAKLAGNVDSKDQEAVSGQANLYVFERDARYPSGHTAFIAALVTPEAEALREARRAECEALEEPSPCLERVESEYQASKRDEQLWEVADANRPAQATPDGRYLLFASANALTPGAEGTGEQLYRYDSESPTGVAPLVRVSIGENGFNRDGNVSQSATFPRLSYHNARSFAGVRGVAISDDGAYVFFVSSAALTPQAINDPSGQSSNVYEFHENQVYLISDGLDRHLLHFQSAVTLLGASHSGSDVFFTTADPLVAQDTDTAIDIYDARRGGGIPAPATEEACVAEGCRSGSSPAPAFALPSSATFTGAGNLTPPATKVVPKPKSLTRTEKLANALKACSKKVRHVNRKKCEKEARARYGPGGKKVVRKK